MTAACTICGRAMRPPRDLSPRLRVSGCRSCGHVTAVHSSTAQTDADYHEQYSSGAFLRSLRETRRRQAGVILSLAHQAMGGEIDALLDYGCGRGWFLDSCREAGVAQLAGADTSPLAMQLLRDRGIEAVLIEPARAVEMLRTELNFRPRVITLLDVIEHIPAEACQSFLRSMVEAFRPELRLLIVKVPSAHGLMYRIASAMAMAGKPAILEQLYQVGTEPPHVQYFTPRSLDLMLRKVGLATVSSIGDRDFEPDSLPDRVTALSRFPRTLAGLASRVLARTIAVTATEDSRIVAAVLS